MYANPKNLCMFTGRLIRDCELQYTSGGSLKMTFTIAANSREKDENGKYVDVPTFVNLTMWGERANALEKLLRKGAMVQVMTTYRQSRSQGEDGKNRYFHNFIVNALEILSFASRNDQPQGGDGDSGYDDSNIGDDEDPF